MKIAIDPGHGGKDPGAVNAAVGAQEKDLNLHVAHALIGWLVAGGHGVHLTRNADYFVELSERAAIANRNRAEAFISIHCNAAGNIAAHGMEIWTTPGETKADALATCIGDALAASFPAVTFRRDESDGDLDKEGRLFVLEHTICPAVLVECGFISNDQEATWLKDPTTIQNLARAISIGVTTWAT